MLDRVGTMLESEGWRYAVVGGIAMAAYGDPRLTLDLDIVTEREAQGPLMTFLENAGYQTLHRSAGFSNHRHADREWGRLDFIYVDLATADRLFAHLRERSGPAGRTILVPRPEHLIAMKVQAIKNAPERTWQDMADIAFLLSLDGVDRVEAKSYFEKAELLERWHDVEGSR